MERIKFKIGGKLVSIARDDWNVLKQRFDLENAKEGLKKFAIEIKCPLCTKYINKIYGTCKGCPFDKFKTEHSTGCGNVLKRVLGELPQFSTTETEVNFSKDIPKARRQLNRLLAFMLRKEEENNATEKK